MMQKTPMTLPMTLAEKLVAHAAGVDVGIELVLRAR